MKVDPREQAKKIREAACKRAEETWVAETSTGVVVLVHPGQPLDILKDPERLKREFGIVDMSIIKRLSESREAPAPYTLDNEIAVAKARLAELEEERRRREVADAQLVEETKAKIENLEAERTESRARAKTS